MAERVCATEVLMRFGSGVEIPGVVLHASDAVNKTTANTRREVCLNMVVLLFATIIILLFRTMSN